MHPGGPFWAKKDRGAWSIPKGEYEDGEEPLAVAKREFEEELGTPAPKREYLHLGELEQPSRKMITAFAVEGDLDPGTLKSNHFEMEWPPKSGKMQSFPEVDRAAWFRATRRAGKSCPGKRRSSTACSLHSASITVRPEGRFYAKERLRSRSERMTLLMLS